MIDTKKEQERDELHRAIWAIADELRGSVDGWDFKSYVLGTMFYRYISENLTNYINRGEAAAGDAQFDYVFLSDEDAEGARADLVQERGFFILPSELFCNVIKRASADENLNMTLGCVSKNGTAAYSSKKNPNTTNVDEREKARCELIEPGSNPSIFFQLVEEAFYQMSLLV